MAPSHRYGSSEGGNTGAAHWGGGAQGGGASNWSNQGYGNSSARAASAGKSSAASGTGPTRQPAPRAGSSPGEPRQPSTAPPAPGTKKPSDSSGGGAFAGQAEGPKQSKPATAQSGKGSDKDAVAFVVSTASAKDEIGIQTLVGDYAERGLNHERKYFQKVQKIPGHEHIQVFLYYWDSRDGPEFSGWWFGDQLGGSQVWARSPSHGQSPPRVGWRIPWDSPKAETGLLLVDAAKKQSPAGQPGSNEKGSSPSSGGTAEKGKGKEGARPSAVASVPASSSAAASSAQAKAKKATEKVTAAETAANATITNAKKTLLNEDSSKEDLQSVQSSLQKQQEALGEVQKMLTSSIAEARQGGPSAVNSVTEMSKLSPRLRTIQNLVSAELGKARAAAARALPASEMNERAEARDQKTFQEGLPAATDAANIALDAVEAVGIMAGPLEADPLEESGSHLQKSLAEIERAALDAQTKITSARNQINVKLQDARKFAPETRKAALLEYSDLQAKLTDAQKKVAPYKNFKKECYSRVEARKALTELSLKLNTAEVEVEKASAITASAGREAMSDGDVHAAEKALTPAQQSVASVLRQIDQKLRTADGAMKTELTQLRERSSQIRKKIDGVNSILKGQKEVIATQQSVQAGSEKLEKVEKALARCQEAEMPFLKGIEVLPPDESAKSISEMEAAAAETSAAVNQAQAFFKTKLAEVKRCNQQDVVKDAADELAELQSRCDGAATKLANFKKETAERKMAALLSEVHDGISEAEAKVDALKEAALILSSEDMDAVSAESVKEASEKSTVAEKEAAVALSAARKLNSSKQRDVKGPEASAQFSKLSARLSAAQAELVKQRRAIANGDKLLTGKELLKEEGARLSKAEESIQRAETLSSPAADQDSPADDALKEMSDVVSSATSDLKAIAKAIDAHMPGALPVVKVALEKILEKCKDGQKKIDAMRAASKKQLERVMCETYTMDARSLTQEVETTLEKVNEAELPFLKGIEVLPLQEATDTIRESEAAAEAVQKAITESRDFIAAKSTELKSFDKAASKVVLDEFASFSDRINAAAQKLASFKKDTEGRKRTAQVQDISERISAVEEDTKNVTAAVEPFTDEDVEQTADDASEAIEKLVQLEKEAQVKIKEARSILQKLLKELKSSTPHDEQLQKLQVRLTETQSELTKAKKVASRHEQKFVAKKLIAETSERVAGIDEIVKTATDACAPLLERSGEDFLVAASVQTLVSALQDHMEKDGVTGDALFSEANAGNADGAIAEEAFLTYLEGLPAALGRDELAFSEQRRKAMFKRIDSSKSGAVSKEDFLAQLQQRFICVKGISITDDFDIAKSKRVGKAEPGDFVVVAGAIKSEESSGTVRAECSHEPSGEKGWVTIKGNQGSVYFKHVSAFDSFGEIVDKAINEAVSNVSNLTSFITDKCKELAKVPNGPLVDAKAELQKLRPKVAGASSNLDSLKKKMSTARSDYLKKEAAERNAHIEAREKKEAAAIVSEAAPKVEAVSAIAKEAENAAKELLAANGAVLDEFEKPASVQDEVDAYKTSAIEKTGEAKSCLKALIDRCGQAPKGAKAEAKKELGKLLAKVDADFDLTKKTAASVRRSCSALVERISVRASAAVREAVAQKGSSVEAYFDELVSGGDKISEDTFVSSFGALENLKLVAEHAKLLCRHIEKGGVTKRQFVNFVQRYYSVVKEIAITDVFEVATCKTMRKAEKDELFQVVDGPRTDAKLGLVRVRGKSLIDGEIGWITVKGNQGTPFLEEKEKPFYCCLKDVLLEPAFDGAGQEPVRTLKADEVVELLEGPRKVVFPDALRVRGKARKDGATGWVTARDKNGITFAEANKNLYTCVATVAMTDSEDVKSCKVIRKLVVGELFLGSADPVDDKVANIHRVRGKALNDGQEGWITLKGNAGTVFAEVCSNHYTILKASPLQNRFGSDLTDVVRTLEEGEAFQVLEGPKEEKCPPVSRIKGRSISDGVEGWMTLKQDCLKKWSGVYTCVVSTPIHDGRVVVDATVLRQLEKGETVELLEGPVADGKDMRIRGSTKNQATTGWMTIRNSDGKQLLK
eukprot:TRINITY_DN20667_c0_g1_i1.p1 TRINITY_DN20667_c0_g1~~TRINITY_DN20667_c0_g1_i1.p1  ORF type:complete len:2068 (-),score=493.97 TRINITY_DN20667_c0_g1_i1:213-6416(-)